MVYKFIQLKEYGKCSATNKSEDCEKWLNDLEKEGWKLIAVTNRNYMVYYFFHKENES